MSLTNEIANEINNASLPNENEPSSQGDEKVTLKFPSGALANVTKAMKKVLQLRSEHKPAEDIATAFESYRYRKQLLINACQEVEIQSEDDHFSQELEARLERNIERYQEFEKNTEEYLSKIETQKEAVETEETANQMEVVTPNRAPSIAGSNRSVRSYCSSSSRRRLDRAEIKARKNAEQRVFTEQSLLETEEHEEEINRMTEENNRRVEENNRRVEENKRRFNLEQRKTRLRMQRDQFEEEEIEKEYERIDAIEDGETTSQALQVISAIPPPPRSLPPPPRRPIVEAPKKVLSASAVPFVPVPSENVHATAVPPPQMKKILVKKDSASNKEIIGPDQRDLSAQHLQLTLALANKNNASLKPEELPTFDGKDVTQFNSFIQIFEEYINESSASTLKKLLWLRKITEGEPNELVVSSGTSPPEEALRKSIDKLKKRYGNELRNAQAYISKWKAWPSVNTRNDVSDLMKLSRFLNTCASNIENDTHLNRLLNNQHQINEIASKLPYKMRETWARKSYEFREKNRVMDLQHLADFVDREAQILDQPEFSPLLAPNKSEFYKPKYKKSNTRSLATTTSTPRGKQENINYTGASNKNSAAKFCLYCEKSSHLLQDCFAFKAKNDAEKTNFVKSKRLCFSCLKPGHNSRFCRARGKCDKCDGSHFPVVHDLTIKHLASLANEKKESAEVTPSAPPSEES